MAKYYYDKYNKDYFLDGVWYQDVDRKSISSNDDVYELKTDFSCATKSILVGNMKSNTLYVGLNVSNSWNSGLMSWICYKVNGFIYQTSSSNYTRSQVSWGPTTLIESDIKAEDGTYPTNGVHSDGYFYIRGKKANEILVYEGASQVNRYNKYMSEIWITKNANSFHNYLTASTNSSYYNSVNSYSVPSTVYEIEINSSGNLIRTNSVSRNDMIINKLYADSSSSSSVNLYVRTATNKRRQLKNINGSTSFTFNTDIKIEKILDSVVEGDFQEGYYNGYFYEKLENKLFTEIKEVWYVDENSQLQRVNDWMVVDEDFLQAQSNEMFLTLDDYKYLMLNDGLDEDTTYHVLEE